MVAHGDAHCYVCCLLPDSWRRKTFWDNFLDLSGLRCLLRAAYFIEEEKLFLGHSTLRAACLLKISWGDHQWDAVLRAACEKNFLDALRAPEEKKPFREAPSWGSHQGRHNAWCLPPVKAYCQRPIADYLKGVPLKSFSSSWERSSKFFSDSFFLGGSSMQYIIPL